MKSLFFLVHVRGHMVDGRCILPASFCAIGHFNVQINVRTGQKGSRIDKRQGKWKDLKSSRTFFNEEANAFDTLVKSPRYKQCILRVKLTVNIALFSKTFCFFLKKLHGAPLKLILIISENFYCLQHNYGLRFLSDGVCWVKHKARVAGKRIWRVKGTSCLCRPVAPELSLTLQPARKEICRPAAFSLSWINLTFNFSQHDPLPTSQTNHVRASTSSFLH